MKKSLFLLPLLAGLALCGCDKNNDTSDKSKKDNTEEKGGDPAEFEGLTISYETLSELSTESGYQSGSIDVSGFEVSYGDIIVKEYLDETYDSGDYNKCEEMLPIIQWKKTSAEFSVADINPTKMTFTYITTYDPADIASVSFDGKTISGKKSGDGVKVGTLEKYSASKGSTQQFDVMRYVYTYAINAEDVGELVIKNKTSFAQYVESIVLE